MHAQQKKGQKIAFFDQIKPKNEPKNQFQLFFLHEKLGLLSFSKEQKSLGYKPFYFKRNLHRTVVKHR